MSADRFAELAPNVTTTRERVALCMGPAPDDTDGDYWKELSRWTDWARWLPTDDERTPRNPGYGELAELPGWGQRVRAMTAALGEA